MYKIIIFLLCPNLLLGQKLDYVCSQFVKYSILGDDAEVLITKYPSEVIVFANKYKNDLNFEYRANAFNLVYEATIKSEDKTVRQKAVDLISSGLLDQTDDVHATVCNNLRSYLFEDFSQTAKGYFTTIYVNKLAKHYNSDFIELTGFLNIKEAIPYFQERVRKDKADYKWLMQIALARMEEESAIQFCVQKIKRELSKNSIDNGYYAKAAYEMRNQAGLDILVELLESNISEKPSDIHDDVQHYSQKELAYDYLTKMLSNLPEQFKVRSTATDENIQALQEYLHSASRSALEINTNIF